MTINNKSILSVIPARGGSERLPRKNILELSGKPLIQWTIEAGLKSNYIDDLIVSSDDDEILELSKKIGSSVIKRPINLSDSTSTTFDVLKHVIENEKKFDYIMLLQPTSPLRNELHIDESIRLLENKNADAIISVCETEHSPLWCNTISEDLDISNFLSANVLGKRSQDLPKYYRLNGAIYICKTDVFLDNKGFFLKENICAYIMNKEVSIDIDEKIDFLIADTIMKEIEEKNG